MSNTMMHGARSTSSSTFSSVLGPVPPRRLITSITPFADSQQPQEGGGCPELPRHTLHGKAALVLQCTFTHVFFQRFFCWCEVHSLFGKIGKNILNTKLFQHGLARSCQIQNVQPAILPDRVDFHIVNPNSLWMCLTGACVNTLMEQKRLMGTQCSLVERRLNHKITWHVKKNNERSDGETE